MSIVPVTPLGAARLINLRVRLLRDCHGLKNVTLDVPSNATIAALVRLGHLERTSQHRARITPQGWVWLAEYDSLTWYANSHHATVGHTAWRIRHLVKVTKRVGQAAAENMVDKGYVEVIAAVNRAVSADELISSIAG